MYHGAACWTELFCRAQLISSCLRCQVTLGDNPKKVMAAAGSSRPVNLEHFTSVQTSAIHLNYLPEDGVYCTNALLMECLSFLEGAYQRFQLRGHGSDLRAQNVSASTITRASISRFHAAASMRSAEAVAENAGADAVAPRLPRNVQAIYLKPLRREAEYGVPSCDLQLRSYSVRNLEFFADFALRAAYYLNLPAFGPVPLPRITERWTVPKSNFIHKKAQENFERITMRRLIQIKDGNPETVELWLAFLKKHAYYGIGMKANVWEYNELGKEANLWHSTRASTNFWAGVGKTMDVNMENVKTAMGPKWVQFGRSKKHETTEKVMELMNSEKFKQAAAGNPPMAP